MKVCCCPQVCRHILKTKHLRAAESQCRCNLRSSTPATILTREEAMEGILLSLSWNTLGHTLSHGVLRQPAPFTYTSAIKPQPEKPPKSFRG